MSPYHPFAILRGCVPVPAPAPAPAPATCRLKTATRLRGLGRGEGRAGTGGAEGTVPRVTVHRRVGEQHRYSWTS
eukprot:487169-Pleurochrysis_carterae.AAC.1